MISKHGSYRTSGMHIALAYKGSMMSVLWQRRATNHVQFVDELEHEAMSWLSIDSRSIKDGRFKMADHSLLSLFDIQYM